MVSGVLGAEGRALFVQFQVFTAKGGMIRILRPHLKQRLRQPEKFWRTFASSGKEGV